MFCRSATYRSVVETYTTMYTLGGGSAKPPSLMDRIRAGLMLAVLIVVGAVILAGILAVSIVLVPFVLVGAAIGWFIIRRRIRQAIRAMEDPGTATTGRENVRVRRTPNAAGPFA